MENSKFFLATSATRFLLILSLASGLTGCFRTRAEIEQDSTKQEIRADMNANIASQNEVIHQLQTQVGILNGKVDELTLAQKKNMGSLGTTDSAMVQHQQKIDLLEKNQQFLFEEIKKIHEQELSRPTGASKSPKTSPSSHAVTKTSGKANKQGARGSSLVEKFNEGEDLFKNKNYEEAILAFSDVQEKDGKSNLGRKASLRIIESFKKLGKNKEARTFAQILVDSAPNSPEAKQARKYLK